MYSENAGENGNSSLLRFSFCLGTFRFRLPNDILAASSGLTRAEDRRQAFPEPSLILCRYRIPIEPQLWSYHALATALRKCFSQRLNFAL